MRVIMRNAIAFCINNGQIYMQNKLIMKFAWVFNLNNVYT